MFKDAILFVGMFQALFAVVVLITGRKVRSSDLILAFCLFSIAVRFMSKIFAADEAFPHSDLSVGIIPLTMGAFLYLYNKYLIKGNPPFNPKDLGHFIPFVLFVIIYQFVFNGQISFDEKNFLVNDKFLAIRIIMVMAFFSSLLIYGILIYQQLSGYQKILKEKNEVVEGSASLRWMILIVGLFCAILVSYFVLGMINTLTFTIHFDLVYISSIGLIILAYVISYFGVRQPSILQDLSPISGQPQQSKEISFYPVEEMAAHGQRVKKTVSQPELLKLEKQLHQYMVSEKPFLNPELMLADVAAELNISKTQLTHLLNDHIGMNFFSYINKFRLHEVIKKLDDKNNKHLTILSIAYDCGFNSKSTFNSAFKKAMLQTPSLYRAKKLA